MVTTNKNIILLYNIFIDVIYNTIRMIYLLYPEVIMEVNLIFYTEMCTYN